MQKTAGKGLHAKFAAIYRRLNKIYGRLSKVNRKIELLQKALMKHKDVGGISGGQRRSLLSKVNRMFRRQERYAHLYRKVLKKYEASTREVLKRSP
jgi:hypothetical protein